MYAGPNWPYPYSRQRYSYSSSTSNYFSFRQLVSSCFFLRVLKSHGPQRICLLDIKRDPALAVDFFSRNVVVRKKNTQWKSSASAGESEFLITSKTEFFTFFVLRYPSH